MPHKVIVVSRRREFHAIASRLLGDGVHPTPARELAPERIFGGRPLTVVLDVLRLSTRFEVEHLPPLPRRLPTVVVLALRQDIDAALAMATEGIPLHPADDLPSGCLAHIASPSQWPFDWYVRMGRLAAERIHALLARRCGVPVLTRRETEVLRLVQNGRSNKDVAWAVKIELQTAKNHVNHILQKLNARSRYELMVRATPPPRELEG